MERKRIINAFDLLATLCSLLTKEEERKYAIKWETADAVEIDCFLKKYKKLMDIILKSGIREYNFNVEEISDIYAVLGEMENMDERTREEVYLLAIRTEACIQAYDGWRCRGMIYNIEPLNANYNEIGIAIYPYFHPQWNSEKSERNRERTLNAKFQNYMFLRTEDALPFKIVMHYWNDSGVLKNEGDGWFFKAAVTPVWDSVKLKEEETDVSYGKGVIVQGIENEQEVEKRILNIFDDIFDDEYSIIIFPEAIGTKKILEDLKCRMRLHPEYSTLVMVPTICCQRCNTLVVLGPGGVEVLNQEKSTPVILKEEKNSRRKEELEFSNELHILITKELGNIVFPICAELLDPLYYPIIENVARADTILCPSFSPGIEAFKKTLIKGLAGMMLSIWINTCSAKGVSKKERVSDIIAIIQLPDANIEKEALKELKRECGGYCYDKGCYFDIKIEYKDEKFHMNSKQRKCA